MTEKTTHGVRVEPSPKRVRAYVDGVPVVDTTRALLVWENPYYPAYYLPLDDVRPGLLVATGRVEPTDRRGDAHVWTLRVGAREVHDAARTFPDSPVAALRDTVRFVWDALDAWFEEDEEVFVHPRSPYTRVDILDSSREVEVSIAGVVVARSCHPRLLFETGLPTRYYLPKVDVRMDLLVATDTVTRCPYKGTARWWSVRAGGTLVEDAAWSYSYPVAESVKIAGLVCFWNERADIAVDGVAQPRPDSPFS